MLAAAAEVGVESIVVAFHGLSEEHDRFVNRGGAFAETCLAVERARSCGLNVIANVFVTRNATVLVETLAPLLASLGVTQSFWTVARYNATLRGRAYEDHRPTLGDLAPAAEHIAALSATEKDKWRSLQEWTEAAHVRRASAAVDEEEWCWPEPPGQIDLVVRPNLDVHAGRARAYGTRHGNLRRDGVETVLTRASEGGQEDWDRLCFGADPLPPVRQLARRAGNPTGEKVYFYPQEMRHRWLDLGVTRRRLA